MPIASIWPETACESHVRTPDIDAHLTTSDIRNIINLDLRKQTAGGRHQIGMLAGFRSEWVAGFVLECMAGFVGIRKLTAGEAKESPSAASAERQARVAAQAHAGAVAFSRTGDPSMGDFQDAVVLAQFGDVDLNALSE
jgi:hypothetical protein